jgi:hypothetical protein
MDLESARKSPDSALGRFVVSRFRPYLRRVIAAEISALARHCDQVVLLASEASPLLEAVDAPRKSEAASLAELPDLSKAAHDRSLVLLDGNLNHHLDAQAFLSELKKKLGRGTRVGAVVYNSYFRFLYACANRIGLRQGPLPTAFLTRASIRAITELAGYEIVRGRPMAYCPFELFGLGTAINRLLAGIPFVRWLGFAELLVLRPRIASVGAPSLSVVIPARNERNNIENALRRMPSFGAAELEVIFVEGHSNDGTWEEIGRVAVEYGSRLRVTALKQSGKGKADAVRLGLTRARGELVTILDADLTVPPESLPRFYDAYVSGHADFLNGNRLVYPMEGEAMRFLNWLGNIFFAKALSWTLETELGDSLCGTKLFPRRDYERMVEWRKRFGDFDPFGDFELLFPAAVLGLGVADVPVRYLARTYGTTQIHRFADGWRLLKMTVTGLVRIRMR